MLLLPSATSCYYLVSFAAICHNSLLQGCLLKKEPGGHEVPDLISLCSYASDKRTVWDTSKILNEASVARESSWVQLCIFNGTMLHFGGCLVRKHAYALGSYPQHIDFARSMSRTLQPMWYNRWQYQEQQTQWWMRNGRIIPVMSPFRMRVQSFLFQQTPRHWLFFATLCYALGGYHRERQTCRTPRGQRASAKPQLCDGERQRCQDLRNPTGPAAKSAEVPRNLPVFAMIR